MTTHYAVLEVNPQATTDDIRRAYRRLVLLTHPDRTPDPAQHRRYLAINEAYETLSDPTRRQRYDAALRQPTAAPVAGPATEPHPDPAMRRRGFRRAHTRARPPLEPMHIRYAAEFQRALPRFRKVAYASLFCMLLLAIDFNRVETLPDETVLEFEYMSGSNRGRSRWSYFIAYTQHTAFRVPNTTELEEGDQVSVARTPWFGKVKSVTVRSGKEQGSSMQISDFSALWILAAISASSALLVLLLKLRPDRAFNLGFANSAALFFVLLYLLFTSLW